jgi:hypothetical protein
VSEGLSGEEVRTLAQTFSTPLAASQLLQQAGVRLETSMLAARGPLNFWMQVSALLGEGLLASSQRGEILQKAAALYPQVERLLRNIADRDPPSGGLLPPLPTITVTVEAFTLLRFGSVPQTASGSGLGNDELSAFVRELVDEGLRRSGIPKTAPDVKLAADEAGHVAVEVTGRFPFSSVVDLCRGLAVALRDASPAERVQLWVSLPEERGDPSRDLPLADARRIEAVLGETSAADVVLYLNADAHEKLVGERLRDLDPTSFHEFTEPAGAVGRRAFAAWWGRPLTD